MKKICLTIDIDVNDKYFDDFIDYKKLNMGDIVSQAKANHESFDLEKVRGKIVAEQIQKSEKHLLIGFAIKNSNDLKTVLELSGENDCSVFTIYFDNGKRKQAAIEKYKQDHTTHSRWLDYPPDFVANNYNEFDKEVDRLKAFAIEQGIEVFGI